MATDFEREFLDLAGIWLACRLATMGGTPLIPQHRPVRDFKTLSWAMLGETDYSYEMKLLCQESKY